MEKHYLNVDEWKDLRYSQYFEYATGSVNSINVRLERCVLPFSFKYYYEFSVGGRVADAKTKQHQKELSELYNKIAMTHKKRIENDKKELLSKVGFFD